MDKVNYCVFGLATCFVKQEGEVSQVQVIEPIPSAALESLAAGIPTSYQRAIALSVDEVIVREELVSPAALTHSEPVQFCPEFISRTEAASRTYASRPQAQALIPLGSIKTDFNYSLERKRILNAVNVVTNADNIKQHSHTHKTL